MLFTEKENKTPTVECEDYVPRMMETALSPFLIRTQKIQAAGLSGMMTPFGMDGEDDDEDDDDGDDDDDDVDDQVRRRCSQSCGWQQL